MIEDAGKSGKLAPGATIIEPTSAAWKAAVLLAQRPENKGKNIVVLLPDSGDRYLSTKYYSNDRSSIRHCGSRVRRFAIYNRKTPWRFKGNAVYCMHWR